MSTVTDWLAAAMWLIHEGRSTQVHPADASALVSLGLARWGADRDVHLTDAGHARLMEEA